MIAKQFAHLSFSPLVHSSSLTLPMLLIILSTFVLRLSLFSVFLQATAYSIDCLIVVVLIIVVPTVQLSVVLQTAVFATK